MIAIHKSSVRKPDIGREFTAPL